MRAKVLAEVRRYFHDEGFLEVETPSVVPNPGLDVHLDAFRVEGARDERWLATSPEYQMKRLLAGGFERIVQVCRCFRQGEVGERHEPEFTMIEWYRTQAGAAELMHDTEQLVARAATLLFGAPVVHGMDVTPPWPRITVREAFRKYANADETELLRDEETFFRTYVDHVEPMLGKDGPVFVTEWPAQMASLARLLPHDSAHADRFEAYARGLELCNGFGELTDAAEQRSRHEADRAARAAAGKPVYPLDERFLGALEAGMPESGGNALGFDRLMMFLLGADHIDDVVAFTQARL